MSAIIEKIKMINYKRFLSYTIYPNQKVNIILWEIMKLARAVL